MQHEAERIAEIGVLAALAAEGRGVQRLHEGRGEAAAIDRPAGIAGVDPVRVDALPDQEHAQLVIADHHRAGRLVDRHGVADMVVVAMRQQHVGHPLRDLLPALAPGRIAGQKRIDQDPRVAGLDAKGRMAEPRDLHGWFSLLLVGGRIERGLTWKKGPAWPCP